MTGSNRASRRSHRPAGRGTGRLPALAIAALGLLAQSASFLVPAGATERAASAVPRQLVAARTVFLMASPFSALKEHFEEELEQWGRLRLVEFPTEADVVVSLGTTRGFVRLPVGDECADAGDDPLCDRPLATTAVFDAFRVEIFVQGGETLWEDEVAVEHDDRAAKILVERLRTRIESAEAGEDV